MADRFFNFPAGRNERRHPAISTLPDIGPYVHIQRIQHYKTQNITDPVQGHNAVPAGQLFRDKREHVAIDFITINSNIRKVSLDNQGGDDFLLFNESKLDKNFP